MATLTIRASSLDKYLDCPRMGIASSYPDLFKKFNLEIKETKRWVTGGVGTAIHAGAEHLNKHWIANHTQPNSDVILEACKQAHTAFKKNLLKDMESADVHYTAKFPNTEAINAHITEYVNLYATVILPARNIESAEPTFKIQLNDNFVLSGHPDSYGSKTLYDLKTGDKVTPAYGQVGVYTYLLTNAGYEVQEAQLDYIRRPKDGEPAQHYVYKYNAGKCMTLAKYTIARLMGDLEEFQKTGDINVILYNPKSTSCNPIFCPLYGTSSCGGWRDK